MTGLRPLVRRKAGLLHRRCSPKVLSSSCLNDCRDDLSRWTQTGHRHAYLLVRLASLYGNQFRRVRLGTRLRLKQPRAGRFIHRSEFFSVAIGPHPSKPDSTRTRFFLRSPGTNESSMISHVPWPSKRTRSARPVLRPPCSSETPRTTACSSSTSATDLSGSRSQDARPRRRLLIHWPICSLFFASASRSTHAAR
jgi:hypothetical protein